MISINGGSTGEAITLPQLDYDHGHDRASAAPHRMTIKPTTRVALDAMPRAVFGMTVLIS